MFPHRDTQLDLYRAGVMIYIVCVIHVLYWLQIGGEPLKSLALFEMPVIFFISGAALSLSKPKRSLWRTVWNRLRRVLFPYYVYACMMVLPLVALTLCCWVCGEVEGLSFPQKLQSFVLHYGWHDVMLILSCKVIPQVPYVFHLWFIVPYLVLTCTFGLQQRLYRLIGNRGGYCVLAVLAFLLTLWTGYFTTLAGYNLFLVAGWLFYKQLSWAKVYWLTLFACVALGCYLLAGEPFCPMQNHKFPVDALFVVYGFTVLGLLSVTVGRFTLPHNRLLDRWNKAGYTIYLYQNVSYAIVALFLHRLCTLPLSECVQGVGAAVMLFVLSTALSYVFVPLERLGMRCIDACAAWLRCLSCRLRG